MPATAEEKSLLILAKHYANLFSDDPDTTVGAVFVSDNNQILSMGCNHSPYRMSLNPATNQNKGKYVKPEKYVWIEHAERNAIYNAVNHGVSLKGSTCIATLVPCIDCTRAIIQAKVARVVSFEPKGDSKWKDQFQKSKDMFARAGIPVDMVEILPSDTKVDLEKLGWTMDKLVEAGPAAAGAAAGTGVPAVQPGGARKKVTRKRKTRRRI
jgi:dCMP deaminase